MQIIISGSLAYDRIMDFPEYFSDHILPEKIHVLNVCFLVNGVTEKFGGTAGNIAYALKLLGEDPLITATIGSDYHRYMDRFRDLAIRDEAIKIIKDELSAGAYITTDKADNQITGFNPGAMKFSSEYDFASCDPEETLLIVSPGNIDDMIRYPTQCKQNGIKYIFDPGQQLPVFQKQQLLDSISGCYLLIVNDYELELILNKTEYSKEDILSLTGATIVTRGEHGSQLYTNGEVIEIPPFKADQVIDPTGCGDAYRGGLLYGLKNGKSLQQSSLLGSLCASFAVEQYGTQEYFFTKEAFTNRLEKGPQIIS
ncbi:MAG: carbohydrate kinase family protein [Desulfobulbaceae bacterium]|nr:MAG: carbohydrate kinase family protein [Desulfobulbaceae bacterium]